MKRYYFIALIVIVIDQLSKALIVKNMELYERIELIENLLYITSFRNKGAAWGILQNQMAFFYIITIIVIIGLIYYLHRHAKGKAGQSVAIAFILGGAIGNFIDRLFRKEVVDFIDVMIFTYDYPIFNLADSFLVIGVILLLLLTLTEDRKGRGQHDAKKD